MKRYKIIAADTKHFRSLFNEYRKTMRVITAPTQDSIAELESDTEFIALYNAEKTPQAYLND